MSSWWNRLTSLMNQTDFNLIAEPFCLSYFHKILCVSENVSYWNHSVSEEISQGFLLDFFVLLYLINKPDTLHQQPKYLLKIWKILLQKRQNKVFKLFLHLFCNSYCCNAACFVASILLTHSLSQNTLKLWFSFHEKKKQMVKHSKFLFDSRSYLTAYWAHLLFTSAAVHRGIQELTWWFSLDKALNYPF